jgi:hypothetical protein
MRDFLFDKGYKGTYFLQNYVNDVKTIEDLAPSDKRILKHDFSVKNMEVAIRSSL